MPRYKLSWVWMFGEGDYAYTVTLFGAVVKAAQVRAAYKDASLPIRCLDLETGKEEML
jgi:hypothetical protein